MPSNCCDVVASTLRNPKEWSRSMGIASRWGNHGRVSCCGLHRSTTLARLKVYKYSTGSGDGTYLFPRMYCTYEEEIMRGRKKKL